MWVTFVFKRSRHAVGIDQLSILSSLLQGENKRPYLDKGRVDRVHVVVPSNVSRKLYNYLKNAENTCAQ